MTNTPAADQGGVSVVDETMDQLIQQASIPNLASLFRKAKEAGAIGPVSVYGEGAPPSGGVPPRP